MKQIKLNKLLLGIWCGTAVIAAAMLGASAATEFDVGTNYFNTKSPLLLAGLITAAISALAGILAAVFTDLKELRPMPFSARRPMHPMVFGYLALIAAIATNSYSDANPTLLGVTLVALIGAAIYSLLTATAQPIAKAPVKTAGIGLLALLSGLLASVYFYFDVSVEMNAPLKLFVQLGLMILMLYYTGELRYLIGKPLPRLFMMLCTLTGTAAALSVVSIPTAFATNAFTRIDYLGCALLILTAAITAAIRLVTILTPEQTKQSPVEDSSDPNSNSDSPDEPTDTNGKDPT